MESKASAEFKDCFDINTSDMGYRSNICRMTSELDGYPVRYNDNITGGINRVYQEYNYTGLLLKAAGTAVYKNSSLKLHVTTNDRCKWWNMLESAVISGFRYTPLAVLYPWGEDKYQQLIRVYSEKIVDEKSIKEFLSRLSSNMERIGSLKKAGKII